MLATVIRAATADDVASLADVTAACLCDGAGAFEDSIDMPAIERRIGDLVQHGAPFLVACLEHPDGRQEPVGFAHAASFLPGTGFGHCVQSAVWVLPGHRGRGIGWAMLRDLLLACRDAGLRQVVAYVRADCEAALALHARLGFAVIGWHRDACRVLGQSHDVVALRRVLDRIAPAAEAEIVAPHGAEALRAAAARLGLPVE